jgi:magnesium chelatase subunit ChlD-like protein
VHPDPASAERGNDRPEALDDRARRGALEPVPVRSGAPPALPSWLLDPRLGAPRAALRVAAVQHLTPRRLAAQRRRRGGHIVGDGPIDWFSTLLSARPLAETASRSALVQPPAGAHTPSGSTAPLSVKRRPRRLACGGRWVLALDCSASMLQSGALSAAKGVARALARHAASRSVEIALVSFGGDCVSTRGGRDGANIHGAIAELGAAGGTPLRRALRTAIEAATRRGPMVLERRLFLFSDGRTRERVDDLAGHASDLRVLVIDCERGALRLGRARRIAAALKADYVHIDTIAAGSLGSTPSMKSAATSQRT